MMSPQNIPSCALVEELFLVYGVQIRQLVNYMYIYMRTLVHVHYQYNMYVYVQYIYSCTLYIHVCVHYISNINGSMLSVHHI